MQEILNEMEANKAYSPPYMVRVGQQITGYRRGVVIALLKDMEQMGLIKSERYLLYKVRDIIPQETQSNLHVFSGK